MKFSLALCSPSKEEWFLLMRKCSASKRECWAMSPNNLLSIFSKDYPFRTSHYLSKYSSPGLQFKEYVTYGPSGLNFWSKQPKQTIIWSVWSWQLLSQSVQHISVVIRINRSIRYLVKHCRVNSRMDRSSIASTPAIILRFRTTCWKARTETTKCTAITR